MKVEFEQLAEVRERLYELMRVQSKRDQIMKRIREQEALIVKLEVELDMEQKDVERLTKMSLANLFHTILRSKTEQLEVERQQALAATLKLQEAQQTLADLKQQQLEMGEQLAQAANVQAEYDRLMKAKEDWLRSCPITSLELEEMEQQISDKRLLLKELQEALSAGRGVLSLLTDASNSLQKAENWGNWDLWANGGLISTHMKHSHVDDARRFIHSANRQLQDFHKELADLQRTANIQVDISGMLKMADYWFDGLITDWIVQGKIKNAQEQTLEALHQIRSIVNTLETDYRATESELSMLKNNRITWIEASNRAVN